MFALEHALNEIKENAKGDTIDRLNRIEMALWEIKRRLNSLEKKQRGEDA